MLYWQYIFGLTHWKMYISLLHKNTILAALKRKEGSSCLSPRVLMPVIALLNKRSWNVWDGEQRERQAAQGRETGTEIEVSGQVEGWLSCVPRACVGAWLRVQSCRPSRYHHPPLPPRWQRQAKGGGGATDLTVNRRWVYSSRSVGRLRRQKPARAGRHRHTVRWRRVTAVTVGLRDKRSSREVTSTLLPHVDAVLSCWYFCDVNHAASRVRAMKEHAVLIDFYNSAATSLLKLLN